MTPAGKAQRYVGRQYPRLPRLLLPPRRPISFVVVRFSGEYQHNFALSSCPRRHGNQVVEVDNVANLSHDNLSRAISHGISLARHDLIAVVHEDVLLPDRWQQRFEKSLRRLERFDPGWGMLGSVGWDADGNYAGHWSDPHQFKDTFGRDGQPFREVDKLDEQLLIFHRRRLPRFDSCLPGIHFLGDDLRYQFRERGLKCYAINAPTIHKYADRAGNRIEEQGQSQKILDRGSVSYVADEAVCLDYISRKHPGFRSLSPTSQHPPLATGRALASISDPVFLLAGEATLDDLARPLRERTGAVVAAGQPAGAPGEQLRMHLYKAIIEKYRCHAGWQQGYTVSHLRQIACQLAVPATSTAPWWIAVAETYLLLEELAAVFPQARYVVIEDGPDTDTGGVPLAARLDNHIGRIALPAAYEHLGLPRHAILGETAWQHCAAVRAHRVALVQAFLRSVPAERLLVLDKRSPGGEGSAIVEAIARAPDGRDTGASDVNDNN